jgi:hypothetical protein
MGARKMARLASAAGGAGYGDERRPSWRRPLCQGARVSDAHFWGGKALCGETLGPPTAIPNGTTDALFQFGRESRKDLKELLATFPAGKWDVAEEYKILSHSIIVTPRKIVIHVLMHEIRHWAQIATLLRVNGLPGESHDFLFSPVLDAPKAK